MPLEYVPYAIAIGLLTVTQLATEAGYRLGRRRALEADKPADAIVTTVLSAMLGLVGLLLGFSFASAGGRFIDRVDIIVREANALGTAYLRTDLLQEPERSACRKGLRDYTAARIELFDELDFDKIPATRKRCEDLQAVFWKAAVDGVRKAGHYDQTILPPLNEVIDIHTTRHSMERRHLPVLVLGILVSCTSIALLLLGYGCGLKGRRHWLSTVSLALLLATVLWLVIDLDYPRAGLLRVNQAPMLSLLESFKANP